MVVALATVIAAPFSAGASTAAVAAPLSCVAPTVEVAPASGRPGTGFVVTGHGFASDCNDTVACEPGKPCPELPPAPPVESVEVTFVQGDQAWPLTTAHPNQSYGFSEAATVPPDAVTGSAIVRAGGVETTFDVTATPRQLARTGSSLGPVVVVSIFLTALGASLLRLRTRLLRKT